MTNEERASTSEQRAEILVLAKTMLFILDGLCCGRINKEAADEHRDTLLEQFDHRVLYEK